MHIYPADHGFNCDHRGSFDQPSRDLARERTDVFFAANLRQGGAMSKITVSAKQLVAEANTEIETLSVEDALALQDDENVVLVDIRDVRELKREGRVPGALHAPRGMLEFWIDPDSPYYREVFGSSKKFVFFCAGGLRSALATQQLQRMGLTPVAHIEGGFGACRDAGGPVDKDEG